MEFLCGELQIHRASGHTPNPGTTQGTSCQGTLVALVFDRFGERVFLTSTNVNKRSTSASRFMGKMGKGGEAKLNLKISWAVPKRARAIH